MSSRRILIATDAVGGVWTYSLELARALREEDIEPVLVTFGPAPGRDQLASAGTIPVIVKDLPLDWTAEHPSEVRRSGTEIAQLAEDLAADVVQLPSAALASGVQFDCPVVAVQHSCVATWWASVRRTPLPHDFSWRRDLVEQGLNAVDAVVAPTAAFAAELSREYDPARPIFVVHNGRRSFGLYEAQAVDSVLTIGRLWDEGKGLKTLDEAASMLDVPVQAIGSLSGPNGAAIELEHVQALGPLGETDIADRLSGRPIFVSAAVYEPFGLALLEAAKAGCALVLSDVPTFRELWSDAALFVPARDAEAFANGVRKLLRNPDLRKAYGRAAQSRSQHFTPKAMGEGMIPIYEEIISARADTSVASAV